jgi:hypothetical protein
MRIAQIVATGASEFEKKAQRTDFAALSGQHEIVVIPLEELPRTDAAVAHIYGPAALPRRPFRGVRVPYVASGRPSPRRFAFGSVTEPAHILTPLRDGGGTLVPEAVDDAWYDARRSSAPAAPTIGSFARPGVRDMVERTLTRIHLLRDDIEWTMFTTPPAPAEIAAVSVWVDPAVEESDYDGYVAEALVCGVTVVAARTAINAQRLEKGRTGFLVPVSDANEMTHAILTALFKPEAAGERESAARQTASKFRVRQRVKVLLPLYETMVR